MGKFLKNRGVALVIMIAVICLSTLFSVHRTLGAKSNKVQDGFYNYTEPYLKNCTDAANGMFTVASNYPAVSEEMTAVRSARNALLDTKEIGEKYTAYTRLVDSVSDLTMAMEELDLSADEQKKLSAYQSSFDTGVSGVQDSRYNAEVRKFQRDTMQVFPTNLLGRLAGVQSPALFE